MVNDSAHTMNGIPMPAANDRATVIHQTTQASVANLLKYMMISSTMHMGKKWDSTSGQKPVRRRRQSCLQSCIDPLGMYPRREIELDDVS